MGSQTLLSHFLVPFTSKIWIFNYFLPFMVQALPFLITILPFDNIPRNYQECGYKFTDIVKKETNHITCINYDTL